LRAFSRLGSLLRSGTPIQFRAPGRAASMVLASQARGKGARGINLHQRHRQAPPACMDALPLQAASPSLQAVAAPGTPGQILGKHCGRDRADRAAAPRGHVSQADATPNGSPRTRSVCGLASSPQGHGLAGRGALAWQLYILTGRKQGEVLNKTANSFETKPKTA